MFSIDSVDFSTISKSLRSLLATSELQQVAQLLEQLETAELIKQLSVLGPAESAIAYRMLQKDTALQVFQELDAPVQAELVENLKSESVREVFAQLDASARVELLDELPATVATEMLAGLSEPKRQETAVLLGYREAATGRVMSPEVLTVYPQLTVEQSLARITKRLGNAEHAHLIMVVDEQRRLLGTIKLSQLLANSAETTVAELCASTPHAKACEPEADAARMAVDRHIELLPVLDQEERLVGVLPLATAIQILEDAEETRTARGTGSEPLHRPYLGTPLRQLVKARIVWLLVLAIGATLTVQVLSSFEATLESMVVLSLFIPLIVGIGGNTGNQAATTVTRALAMGDVSGKDFWRVLQREVRIGAILGLCLGTLAFIIAGMIFEPRIGVIIGLSLVALCSLAAAVGGIMPIIGKFFKVDPAVFSNPFISTFVDAAGLIVYFSVAVMVLG